ncbi:MAG: VanZ family protein [Deltaproteobacteria bacterium]|nr:VanZ family protein [Deltaproteobacteria bacterium]
MESSKRLWIFIGIYIALIYISLPVVRYFLNFLYSSIGKDALDILLGVISAAGILSFFYYERIWNLEWKRITAFVFLLIFFTVTMQLIKVPEEKVHILEYGFLGILVYKGYKFSNRPLLRSVIFVGAIGIGDEFIQWLLPNRVGEIKDVGLNLLGGIFGVLASTINDKKA